MEPVAKTTRRVRRTAPGVEAGVRELRRNPAPAERREWEATKGRRRNGLRVRQQRPVGPFVLDVACPSSEPVEIEGAPTMSKPSRALAETNFSQLMDTPFSAFGTKR